MKLGEEENLGCFDSFNRLPCEQLGVYYKRDPIHVQWRVDFVAPFGCASKC